MGIRRVGWPGKDVFIQWMIVKKKKKDLDVGLVTRTTRMNGWVWEGMVRGLNLGGISVAKPPL